MTKGILKIFFLKASEIRKIIPYATQPVKHCLSIGKRKMFVQLS